MKKLIVGLTVGLLSVAAFFPMTAHSVKAQTSQFQITEGFANVETVEKEGTKEGIALSGEGRDEIFCAQWSEKVPANGAKVRFDLKESNLWNEEAKGYLEMQLGATSSQFSIRITPSEKDEVNLAFYLKNAENDGETALLEKKSVALTENADGEKSVVGFAVYQTDNLLDLTQKDWNFAFNGAEYRELKDYQGKVPAQTKNEKERYALGQIKAFLDEVNQVSLSFRAVNTSEEALSCRVLFEQVASEVLYDVKTGNGGEIYANEEEINYQKIRVRWKMPEEISRSSGMFLYRYSGETLQKKQAIPSIARTTYDDDELSQKITYTYELELVDDVSLPVPRVEYRFQPLNISPQQGNPALAIGIFVGIVAACVAFVLGYAYFPVLIKKLKKHGEKNEKA